MHNKPHLHFQMTKHSQFLNVTSQDSFVPALGIDVSFPYANHRFISAIIGAIKWGGGITWEELNERKFSDEKNLLEIRLKGEKIISKKRPKGTKF